MKGTVIMRYVGNRQEPEDKMSAPAQDLLESPPLPISAEEFLEELHDFLVGVGKREKDEPA